MLRGMGDMVRTVGARCDRRPSSNSQGKYIVSLNTSGLMTGMLATCRLLGSQVGDAGGLEGFSLAHYVFLTMITVTFSSLRHSVATFGFWGWGFRRSLLDTKGAVPELCGCAEPVPAILLQRLINTTS